jgi:TonB family protein
MREAQIEGRVLLRVLVGTDGLPKRIVVAGGSKVLGEEAAKTLRLWTFRPGLSNGEAAEVWLDIPVNYRLIR